MRADGEISKDEYSEMKSRCEADIEKFQKELTSITESDTIETRKVIDIDKIKARLQQLTAYNAGNVPSEIIEAFVAAIIPEDDGKHFSWYLTLDDDEYHQSFCTLEGRKNTLRLDVQTVEDEDGALPTFFHNQYFAEAEKLGKNPFQRGVLHRRIYHIHGPSNSGLIKN